MTSASTGSGIGRRPRPPTSRKRSRSRRKSDPRPRRPSPDPATARHHVSRQFAETYIRDHADAEQAQRGTRPSRFCSTLNRAFGSLILHEITAHRIEQFKRDRLAGKWRGHGYKTAPKPLKPATVNRELDCLRGILSKAVEWGKLLDSPVRTVKRLKVDNRRTRILTEDEQMRLLDGVPA